MGWTVSLSDMQVVHTSGLRVKFEWKDGGWDGAPIGAVPKKLGLDPQYLASLMREAGDAFAGALRDSAAKYRCLRCGHGWNPRAEDRPRICPACKSPYWDRPRRR